METRRQRLFAFLDRCCPPGLAEDVAERVRLTNRIALFYFPVFLGFLITTVALGRYVATFAAVALLPMVPLVWWLHRRGFSTLGRIVFVCWPTFLAGVGSFFVGAAAARGYIFLSLALVPQAIFLLKERRLRYTTIVAVALTHVLVHFSVAVGGPENGGPFGTLSLSIILNNLISYLLGLGVTGIMLAREDARYLEIKRQQVALVQANVVAQEQRLAAELATQRESQRAEEQRQFAHIAAHDLRAPVRNIAGLVNILLEDCESVSSDPTAVDYIDMIVARCERMEAFVEALLDYSVSGLERDHKRVDLEKIVRDAAADFQVVLAQLGGRCEVGRLPPVLGDETTLVQLFSNLIGNAVKYRSQRDLVIQVTARENGDHVTVSVWDNGRGIAQDQLGDIFQPFKRVGDGKKIEGHGLGLATCTRIVKQHEGRIEAKSEYGAWTEVVIELPALDLSARENCNAALAKLDHVA